MASFSVCDNVFENAEELYEAPQAMSGQEHLWEVDEEHVAFSAFPRMNRETCLGLETTDSLTE